MCKNCIVVCRKDAIAIHCIGIYLQRNRFAQEQDTSLYHGGGVAANIFLVGIYLTTTTYSIIF